MVGRLLASFIGISKKLLRFPHQREDAKAATTVVMTAFGDGCSLGLRGGPYGSFRAQLEALPWHLRSYFCEGHATGLGGRSAFRLRRENPDLFYGTEEYKVARFLGYGFWNGLSSVSPVPALSADGPYWAGVLRWKELHSLVGNGSAYSAILSYGAFDGKIKSRILALRDAEARQAALHGAGRVLWLLYMYNFPALRELLDSNSALAEHIGIGMGFAIGFLQAVIPERIQQSIAEFSPWQQAHLKRGAGIALAVHACNDAEGRDRIEALAKGELREWYDTALAAARDAGAGPGWYGRYHDLTKRSAG